MFSARAFPDGDRARMLERDAASGEVLRKAAPRSEVELVGLLQLRQIPLQAWAFGKQLEDAALIQHVDVIAPDHVIDGCEFLPIAHQRRRETSDAVFHATASLAGSTFRGIGTATAWPDR